MSKNKTIAEIIFGEKPKNKYKILFDKNRNKIYSEGYTGWWRKSLYNNQNEEIYIENSFGDVICDNTTKNNIHDKSFNSLLIKKTRVIPKVPAKETEQLNEGVETKKRK